MNFRSQKKHIELLYSSIIHKWDGTITYWSTLVFYCEWIVQFFNYSSITHFPPISILQSQSCNIHRIEEVFCACYKLSSLCNANSITLEQNKNHSVSPACLNTHHDWSCFNQDTYWKSELLLELGQEAFMPS